MSLETVGGYRMVCKNLEVAGVIDDAGTVMLTEVGMTLSGCEAEGFKCRSEGKSEGVVETSAVSGVLGVILKGETALKNKLGIELTNSTTAGGPFLSAMCGGVPVETRGYVIFPVTANKMLIKATYKATATKGKQKPERFEGGPKAVLETSISGGGYTQSDLVMTAAQTNEEAIEFNSVF